MSPRKMWRGRGGGGAPPEGWYASPTGSATGAGTYADPWTLKVAMEGGYPLGTEVQPGDTVWLRGGTYTAPASPMSAQGRFSCQLDGTAGNPITFRNYPGELATIDGNYDNGVTGDCRDTIAIEGDYQIWRGLVVKNSQADRYVGQGGAPPDARGDGFGLKGPYSKIINCIVYDTGESFGAWSTGRGGEINGCLSLHNGMFQPETECDCCSTIDLAPSGGSAVALSGSVSSSQQLGSSVTFSYNHTGDCLVVGAAVSGVGTGYTDITATFNDVSMNRINGRNNSDGGGAIICATFVLTNDQGATTGTHDVVVSFTSSKRVFGMAQSFSNVHQSSPATAQGGWNTQVLVPGQSLELPPNLNTVSSATNHLLVDAGGFYGAYSQAGSIVTYATTPHPEATVIGTQGSGTGNPMLKMSYGVGAATVDMGWTWDPTIVTAGHGLYGQESITYEDLAGSVGDATVTSASNPFTTDCVGNVIAIEGAGPAGALLITTIASRNSAGSVELADTAGSNFSGARGKWAPGKTLKDNIFYDQLSYNMQLYGTSGTGFLGADVSGNAFIYKSSFLGGLSGYKLSGTSFHDNYAWASNISVGNHCTNLEQFSWIDNYWDGVPGIPYEVDARDDPTVTGNTIIGAASAFQTQYPTNTYYIGSTPTTNVIFVLPNDYETNRANVYVYNWELSANVDLEPDLTTSGAVAEGTAIYVINAQDYFASPVWTGTYHTGSAITISMSGLTVQTPVGYDYGYSASPTSGPDFAAFIVRAQSEETWR